MTTPPTWNLDSVLEYFNQDTYISGEISAVQFSAILNPDVHLVQLFQKALEYQGFDPKIVLRQMIRNSKAYNEGQPTRISWDLGNLDGNFQVNEDTAAGDKYSNKETLSRDIGVLILVFLARNNHNSKIIKRSRNGLSDILEMLKEKYEINDETRDSGTALGSTDVTLPRIAAIFPSTAVRYFHNKVVKEIVPYEIIPGCPEAFTHAICCPFLPSCHPKSVEPVDHIHAIMLFVTITLDDIIHRKDKNTTSLDSLLTYYRAGYESNAMPEKARLEVFRHIGIMKSVPSADQKNAFVQKALSCNSACYNALVNMRTDDPHHGEMTRVANGII